MWINQEIWQNPLRWSNEKHTPSNSKIFLAKSFTTLISQKYKCCEFNEVT